MISVWAYRKTYCCCPDSSQVGGLYYKQKKSLTRIFPSSTEMTSPIILTKSSYWYVLSVSHTASRMVRISLLIYLETHQHKPLKDKKYEVSSRKHFFSECRFVFSINFNKQKNNVLWPMCRSSPCADDHAGNTQKLQPGLGHWASGQVAVHTAYSQMQRQAREILHGGYLHQPVHQDVPYKSRNAQESTRCKHLLI